MKQDVRNGETFYFRDKLEFEAVYNEIFQDKSYQITIDNNNPVIIDAGAHIGLATIFFHIQYPKAKFICVEPDPLNVEVLKKNLQVHDITNVQIVEAGLSGKTGEVDFWRDESWSVFSSIKPGGWLGERNGKSIRISTITLAEVVKERIDLLKMDVEGAELEVLEAGEQKLAMVDNLLLEYHHTDEKQRQTLNLLLGQHFRKVDFVQDTRKEKSRGMQLYLVKAIK